MERTIEHEHRVRIGASYRDIFRTRNGSLRRFEIAAVCYSTHTWSGFILQNYVTYFFKSAGLPTADAYKLSLGCYAISFVATCCCFAYAVSPLCEQRTARCLTCRTGSAEDSRSSQATSS
jgi:SP family general alpha glucoside:H+ symporter-like MFS transporter